MTYEQLLRARMVVDRALLHLAYRGDLGEWRSFVDSISILTAKATELRLDFKRKQKGRDRGHVLYGELRRR